MEDGVPSLLRYVVNSVEDGVCLVSGSTLIEVLMKTIAVLVIFPAILCFSCQMGAQGTSAQVAPAACGTGQPSFSLKEDSSDSAVIQPPSAVIQPPAGKALVYVIEQMPSVPLISTKVAVGVNGKWVGETKPRSYISFAVDPGMNHICATYQGDAAVGEEGKTILRRLNVEAGQTYYLLYRGIFSRNSGEVAFFDEVDEDEGAYLLQTSHHLIATPKR